MQSEAERVRYDRQVRLWGSGVQQRLHSTVLIVVGTDPDETLKNLVLAGVGRVRVVVRQQAATQSSSNDAATRSELGRSVVALSGPLPPSQEARGCVELAVVEGLRVLNNLVDARSFDPAESFADASCVAVIVQPGCSVPPSLAGKVDLEVRTQFFTHSYALCDFVVRDAASAAAAAAATCSDAATPKQWTRTTATPPLAALLACATENAAVAPDFSQMIALLAEREPCALECVGSEDVETVIGEVLPSCGRRPPSTVLNAVLGGVLSQQIIAHACEARGIAVQASGAGQPKPVSWLFCTTRPHIECIVG